MRKSKKVISALLMSAMVMGLAACGQSAGDGGSTAASDAVSTAQEQSGGTGETESGTADTGAADTDSTETAEGSGPVEGGDLVIIDMAEVTSMAWYKVQSFNDKFQTMITCYETLLRTDESGQIVPWLAKSFESDQEAKTYTITLNEGVKFHDGSELNAEAATWCLGEYLANGVKSQAFFSNIDSFEVTGDYTFVIHLKNWDATIPYSLARECGIMVSKQSGEGKTEEELNDNPVGTGPFMFESMTRDSEKKFVRFDDYWQGKPYLDSVTIKIYSDALVSEAAMRNGDAQILYATDYKLIDSLVADNCHVSLGVPSQIALLCFNCTDEENNPFYDVKVRQAISYAIDKEALAMSIYSNYAVVTNQFAPEGSAFYSDDVVGYDYDPEKAKELLAEAGYPDGFSTTCIVRNDIMQVNCVTAIQAMLAEIGVQMEVDVQDSGDFSVNMPKWSTGMFFHTSSLPMDVTNQMSSMFKQGLSGVVLGLDSLLRPDNLNDEILAAVGAANAEEAQAHIRDAQVILIDEICDLNPVATVYQPMIKSNKLHDDGVNDVEYAAGTLYKAWLEP
ncbi:MAG: ABC transporter substrate-binding protein [Lachnospiraceae bacterium]|nr:ABC transporter substrate-binding protein [Lachnospiraceae bacterium]